MNALKPYASLWLTTAPVFTGGVERACIIGTRASRNTDTMQGNSPD